MAIHRMLVPLDFSRGALNALAYAGELAQQFHAEVVLLHVVEPIHFITTSDVYDEQRRLSDAHLTRIAADLRKRGHRVQIRVEVGVPARVIVDSARRSSVDLIVMGTHGRTGLARVLIGSVAEKVVRTAGCAVLTVRATLGKRKSGRAVGSQRNVIGRSRPRGRALPR